MSSFVDTNVFLHYLLRYDEAKAARCYQLLKGAEMDREELHTSAMVIAEVVWFLSRPPFRLDSKGIRERVGPILELPGLRVPEKRLLREALDLHADSPLNFIDAYNAATMQRRGLDRIYSYDTGFDRVPGIARLEP